MAIKSATPYLILGGKADEAISFYKSALGAKLESLQRFGDADHNCPEGMKSWVMHGVLQLGQATIFLSDGSPEDEPVPGGTLNVALHLDDEAQARACFDGLSSGGNVYQPLIDAPWGALFGAVRDRYGINWMFNAEKKQA